MAVKVKKLEWFGGDPDHTYTRGALLAYSVRHDGNEPDEWSLRRGDKLIGYHWTEETARNAAQADFERCILSAIEED